MRQLHGFVDWLGKIGRSFRDPGFILMMLVVLGVFFIPPVIFKHNEQARYNTKIYAFCEAHSIPPKDCDLELP